jgi:Uma2 family endonuclease
MPATAILTSEQYLALPDQYDKNGNRIKGELIAGEVVQMPPASRVHDQIKNRINRILGRFLDAHPKIRFDTLVEVGAEVSNQDVFVPDVSVISTQRLSGDERVFQGASELAIEVVSPSDTAKHLKIKVDAYLTNGSKTVWVVYPGDRSVMAHTAGAARELKADQKIEDPLLPGFSHAVSGFFELT